MNCFQIGGILAETKRVLMVDCDPQANLSAELDIDITDRDIYSILDVFENPPKTQPAPEDIVIHQPIPELPNLDVIPSSILLFRSERRLFSKTERERILSKYIEKHRDYFEQYDYLICDTNPSLSIVNTNVFYASDVILLTTDVSANSLLGAELFCALWDEDREELGKEDNILALIVSNYSGISLHAKKMIEEVRKRAFSRDIVCDTIISTTVKLKETESAHKPINVYLPKHKATKQYRALVQELFDKEVL